MLWTEPEDEYQMKVEVMETNWL